MIVCVNLQYHQEVASRTVESGYLYHRSLSLSPQASCEAQEREIFALTALRDPWLIELQSLVEMSMELRHKKSLQPSDFVDFWYSTIVTLGIYPGVTDNMKDFSWCIKG